MRCAWPWPCDKPVCDPEPGSMLAYCFPHRQQVKENRAVLLNPEKKPITDPKLLAFLKKEAKERKRR